MPQSYSAVPVCQQQFIVYRLFVNPKQLDTPCATANAVTWGYPHYPVTHPYPTVIASPTAARANMRA